MTAHVLAFDTTGSYCAAALLVGDRIIATHREEMTKGQAERLLPLLEQVLVDGGVVWSDLTALGVGIGPGNFTGIRISVATARGLALSLGIPAVGVSLLDALAEGDVRPVLALLDARRGSVYAQRIGVDDAPKVSLLENVARDFAGFDGVVLGYEAAGVANAIGCASAVPPVDLTPAIAQIATRRASPDTPRPVPLYVRTPDAAPARDTAPKLLTSLH